MFVLENVSFRVPELSTHHTHYLFLYISILVMLLKFVVYKQRRGYQDHNIQRCPKRSVKSNTFFMAFIMQAGSKPLAF